MISDKVAHLTGAAAIEAEDVVVPDDALRPFTNTVNVQIVDLLNDTPLFVIGVL